MNWVTVGLLAPLQKQNRLFLERLRKKYGIKLTHWCITELGSEKGRIHIHGIFFIKENQDIKYIKDKIKREWDFGWNYLGYVDQGKTINYVTKYMLKENENFKEFKPKVLTSQKIGIGFIERNKRFYKYKEKNGEIEANTKMEYLDGRETYLIKYYKEKLYTTEERENIRLSILDENKRRINSREFKGYDLETELEYNRFLIQERAIAERLEPIKEEERTLGKKIRKIIPVVGIGAILYYLFSRKAAESLGYIFSGVSFHFDGITPVLDITLRVQNVNNRTFNINGFVGQLYSGSEKIGQVYSFTPVVVSPLSSTPVTFSVRLSAIGIVADIIKRIQTKQGFNYQLRLVGSLNAEGFILPVDEVFSV